MEASDSDLWQVVVLLAAGVVAVPIFKRLGLGSVLGYLGAGLLIGPFGLGFFSDPEAIIHVAELGVVMFLFIIGLEMQPSRLWALRRAIFGLGVTQVGLCGAALTGIGMLFGLPPLIAFVAGMGFTLTSTAVVVQILEERGEVGTPEGQRFIAILLLEDLAIVPLLALVALFAPGGENISAADRWRDVASAAIAVVALVAAGRWLLNPFFRILAAARAREVMTGAALLVVLGSALAMQVGGLSMAMGAFLAGVLLSESTFRHQLEADIDPFRGLLLGLFFLGVGMSLDIGLILRDWHLIFAGVAAYMAAKSASIYVVARLFRARHREALYRAALFAQGGEFAFVLYSAAASARILDAGQNAVLTAAVILSMALTPLTVLLVRRFLPPEAQPMDGIDVAEDLTGTVLIVGFGRFGQVVSQSLLARGFDVSIIDTDTEMIRAAGEFGFKVYYGDGTRLDVLRASGAAEAGLIAICVDDRGSADRIVEIARAAFPLAQILVRSFDREHALKLVKAGVGWQVRETFESAMAFGGEALRRLGIADADADETVADIRRRDAERFALEMQGVGLREAANLLHGNVPTPTPFTAPKRTTTAAQPEALPVDDLPNYDSG